MSGETEGNVSGWTVDTLHVHLVRQLELIREQIRITAESDRRAIDLASKVQQEAMKTALASAEKAVDAALAAQKEATKVSQDAVNAWRAVQNEWRGSLDDVLTRAMPRAEAEAVISRATEQIGDMRTALALSVTRVEMEASRQRDAERFTELQTRVTKAESIAQAAKDAKGQMLTIMGLGFTVIIIVIAMANYLTSRS